ncbi:MAG TPA: ADP-ribosylglycohydrolase family protein [Chthonomonadaceae bacterium]|nr:ADP-ribosylglycohydrolase family protein [Chthonomonadaceae bacterium]
MAALTLTLETYRDKVFGGWQGKSAGVTLGTGLRGQLTPGRNNFYSPVPGQPAASAALDFPLVWLEVMEQAGPEVAPEDLAVAWLEHLDYPQDEFGYAALNLRRGLPPPASGAYNNWFRHATGGVMRADFWALLAPGAPQVAAAYAYHDAKLDHCEDGLWAAMFLAALGSAAFFLSDPLILTTIGLAMIPRTCRTARAIKTALAAAQRAATWLEARESVQHEVGHPNFTDVAQNMGFFTIGLFYGSGDFGGSLCAAVNCGYDSEIVGGALGAVLGILRGGSGLPAEWTRPIGDILIPGLGMRDFEAPMTLTEAVERTMAVGQKVVAARCPDVQLGEPPSASSFLPPDIAERPLAPETPETAAAAPAAPETPSAAPEQHEEPAPFTEVSAPPPGAESLAGAPAPERDKQQAEEAKKAESAAGAPAPPAVPTASEAASAVEATAPQMPAPEAVPSPTPEPQSPSEAASPAQPGVLRPQPVAEAAPIPQAVAPAPSAPEAASAAPAAPVAPDLAGAIAWADNTLIKPLLVTPPNAFFTQAGDFEVVMDAGETPTIAFNQPRTLTFSVVNRGASPFSGRVTLLAPPGWQVTTPPTLGQRQYIAASTGTLRTDFTLHVKEGQGRIDIANTVMLRFAPEGGGTPVEAEFMLMGASCWWAVGPFANFDGEGFDRSYMPEDRPGLGESYLSRNLQQVQWQKLTFPESVLDLEPLFRGSSGVCYGQTILRSPTTREARLVANTNSGVKVWLNGALVLRRFNREVFRPQLGSGPWAVDVTLRAGDNQVLVKWVRGSEPFAFSLTVSDRQGRGLPEVGNTSW